jgi:hypothetical protein
MKKVRKMKKNVMKEKESEGSDRWKRIKKMKMSLNFGRKWG